MVTTIMFWKVWTIHSFESKTKILQENKWRKKILSYSFTINNSKNYRTKFWESIWLWMFIRMWGWYTLDVSSLAPSSWKMFQVFPALSFVKIWKILLNKIRETIFQDEGAKLETSNVYHPHILMDIQSHMDSQNFVR